jgi:long-subunit fatty acid transport protein
MKLSKLIIILLFTVSSSVFAQKFIAGAEGSLLMPYSGLADRFESTPSFAVFMGKEVSPQWTWTGKLEYFRFSRINHENYNIKRKITVNTAEIDITLPLQDTTRTLSSVGLTANADYYVFRSNIFDLSLGFGFGLFRWEQTIGSFHDSLYYTDNSGSETLVEVIKIPSVKQVDWSGGFNLGFRINVNVFGPLWFNAGADYKNIIGELWAVLALDMENVSTFQMFQTKAGFSVRL